MTNEEIIKQALSELGAGWHTTRDVADCAQADGWTISTRTVRSVCQRLYRSERAYILVHGGKFFVRESMSWATN